MPEQTPRSIVVGCDGSWHSHRAVCTATREAVRRDEELIILAVPVTRELRSDRLGEMARSEQDAVSTAAVTAGRGLDWARETDPAVRARALVLPLDAPDLAALLTATELLVLGGHGRGGQRAFSLGSTSLQLAHAAAAPLLLAAPDGPVSSDAEHAVVVVGLDAQSWSRNAFAYAMKEAVRREAALVVVWAVLPRQPRVAAAVARATQDCATALEDVPAALTKLTVLVTVAPVFEALLQACPPTSLLVLGNRGSGRVQGPVPGSLTQRIIEAAACDVLLVPAQARDDRLVAGVAAVAGPV